MNSLTEKLTEYLNNISSKSMYKLLYKIYNEDVYVKYFEKSIKQFAILELLSAYELVLVASDDRVLLSETGKRVLQALEISVEIEKY